MKKIMWIVLLVAVIAVVFGAKEYFRGHENLANSKPDVTVNSDKLVSDFDKNEETANLKYVNKIVQISGKIVENMLNDSDRTIILEGDGMLTNIACQMIDQNVGSGLKSDEKVTLRCKCNGKLMDINMNMCVVVN